VIGDAEWAVDGENVRLAVGFEQNRTDPVSNAQAAQGRSNNATNYAGDVVPRSAQESGTNPKVNAEACRSHADNGDAEPNHAGDDRADTHDQARRLLLIAYFGRFGIGRTYWHIHTGI
jgi:hypothetical protein